MLKIIILIMSIMIIGISSNPVYSQEISLSTFQETAQLFIDNKITQETITSITLLSSNIQEIKNSNGVWTKKSEMIKEFKQ